MLVLLSGRDAQCRIPGETVAFSTYREVRLITTKNPHAGA